MYKKDITVYRRNVVTVVKGVRKRCHYDHGIEDTAFQKNERKFGEFTLNFKIPDEFERKWSFFEVSNGILYLKYNKDQDDMSEGELQEGQDD